jgi:polyisoprenoid-binding protein YceI
MSHMLKGACFVALLVSLGQWSAAGEPLAPGGTVVAPAGTYMLDKAHASIVFRISHLGFSNFTSRLSRFDATLEIDPANPSRSRVTATVDPRSVEIFGSDLAAILQNAQWFDSARFSEIRYRSTSIALSGPASAHVTGEMTMHGVTKPVALDVVFNGGYGANPMDPKGARIGFSAHGSIKRSDFGMRFGIPAPGTTMGVGDNVDFAIEAEFTHPAGVAGVH